MRWKNIFLLLTITVTYFKSTECLVNTCEDKIKYGENTQGYYGLIQIKSITDEQREHFNVSIALDKQQLQQKVKPTRLLATYEYQEGAIKIYLPPKAIVYSVKANAEIICETKNVRVPLMWWHTKRYLARKKRSPQFNFFFKTNPENPFFNQQGADNNFFKPSSDNPFFKFPENNSFVPNEFFSNIFSKNPFFQNPNQQSPAPAPVPAPAPAPTPAPAPDPTRPPYVPEVKNEIPTVKTPAELHPILAAGSYWLQIYRYANQCGPVKYSAGRYRPVHTILGGDFASVGEFPWLSAVYHYKRKKRQIIKEFVCGANLISDSYVITAAHCVFGQSRVEVEFGRYDITNLNEEFISRPSDRIIQHPEYRPETAHADIALIFFEKLQFTDKLKPICIWPYGSSLDLSAPTGTISGWGQTELEDINNVPKKTDVYIIDLEVCKRSHELLPNIATEKTFCAEGNSSGPCRGDSGGGFYMNYNNRWYIRGIISTSIGKEDGKLIKCDLSNYAVYADLTYFLKWLEIYVK